MLSFHDLLFFPWSRPRIYLIRSSFSWRCRSVGRVAVVDFDVHLATGTADILCRTLDPAFLYASIAVSGACGVLLHIVSKRSIYCTEISNMRYVNMSNFRYISISYLSNLIYLNIEHFELSIYRNIEPIELSIQRNIEPIELSIYLYRTHRTLDISKCRTYRPFDISKYRSFGFCNTCIELSICWGPPGGGWLRAHPASGS